MYTVNYTKSAAKTLHKLPRNVSALIVGKINQYAADPASQGANVKKLSGAESYRLRVGDWRVLFTIDNGVMVITILAIGSRGSIYE
jgi:mRNA interferase RelE/StbE